MMNEPGLVVRVDANNRSGFGHLSRCINMVRHFLSVTQHANSYILFVGNFNEFSQSLLSFHQYDFVDTNTETDLAQVLARESTRRTAVLIDSYFVDQKVLDDLCHLFNKTIIVDDSCQLRYELVDLLINFRYSAESLFSPDARTSALGAAYYVTRPELLSLRNKNTTVKSAVTNMMIFMGGGYANIETTQRIVDISRQIHPDLEITCISNQPALKTLRGVKLIEPTMEVETLLDNCDLCINGGGLIKYECVYSRVPSASLSTTELQDQDTKLLAAAGLIQDLGMDGSGENTYLQQRLGDILSDHELRKSLFDASSTLFDSHSAEKLVHKIQAVM